MRVSFPAMQGVIGQRTYYACLMKLSAIPKMFTFRDWAEFTPEDREQRILNKNRVPGMAKYIVDNEDGYIFSSITASYKCEVEFKPIGDKGLGVLEMEFEEANFVINDGQHRSAAIAYALKENPALGEETISVLLFPYENRERVQQMFSDLNRFVVKTSKSLDILFDKRDPLSTVTLEVCEHVPVFKGMVEKDAVSLPVRSPKLFSLSALYDANDELLKYHRENGAPHHEMVSVATDYWISVSKAIPEWNKVKIGDIRAIDLRQEKISSHAVVLRALGGIGAELMKEDVAGWKSRLLDLSTIDWSKKNRDWENICIIANSVVSNRQARLATKAYIKRHLGLPLNESESRAVMPAHSPIAELKPVGLTTEQEKLLSELLPKIVKRFDRKSDVDDKPGYLDCWFELPNRKEKYASLGFERGDSLYWSIDKSCVADLALSTFLDKGGYQEDRSYLWKYVSLPREFFTLSAGHQEAWMIRCIEDFLSELEGLNRY